MPTPGRAAARPPLPNLSLRSFREGPVRAFGAPWSAAATGGRRGPYSTVVQALVEIVAAPDHGVVDAHLAFRQKFLTVAGGLARHRALLVADAVHDLVVDLLRAGAEPVAG